MSHKLKHPRSIGSMVDLQANDQCTPEFIYVVNRGNACRIVDKNGEVVVDFQYGSTPDEALKSAYLKYKKTPKRKTKLEIIDENASLRERIADLESRVQTQQDSPAAEETSGDPESSSDDPGKTVKKKPRKQRPKPPPQATEFPHLN